LRNIRREYIDEVKSKEKKKELSEEKQMEQICQRKRKEIMEE